MFEWIRKRFEDFRLAGVLQDLAELGCGRGTVEPLDAQFPGIANVWRASVVLPDGSTVERFGFGPFRALRAVRDTLEFRAQIVAERVRRGGPPLLPGRFRAKPEDRARETAELLS
jgi:hypothetical protein